MADFIGKQKVWIEGHPTPYYLGAGHERKDDLLDTAYSLFRDSESDIPERVLRPRRIDWPILILVGAMALFAGIAIRGFWK